MIKKVIALVLLSFFVMTGLSVLNQGNQNYNISENYINSFVVPSSKSIVNLTYISDFKLSNLYYNNASITIPCQEISYTYPKPNLYSASYESNLYYFGYYNSNYYIYKYSLLSNSISQFVKLNFTPQNLGIYSGYLYISPFRSCNVLIINLNTNNSEYLVNPTNNIRPAPDLFYNGSIISMDDASITIYNITNKVIVNSYNFGTSITDFGNWESGNYLFGSIEELSNSINYIWNFNLKDFGQAPITTNSNGEYPIFSYNNYSYIPASYDGSNYLTSSTVNEFTANSSVYLPFMLSATDYDNFSFSPYNFYASSLGNKSINFYPHFINGYKDNTFLYSTLNNQKYYMSLPFNFSSSNTYFLAQGKAYLYMINPYNDMVYIFRNPAGELYHLTVNSYNSLANPIHNYLLFNGKLENTNINIITSYPCVPTIIPLNYSTYYYNGSKIIITSSDYTGSFNKYYNLSIYYNQVQAPSIPLYDIFTYMYPISIIGLFVGMGAFVFAIKKRGYKI